MDTKYMTKEDAEKFLENGVTLDKEHNEGQSYMESLAERASQSADDSDKQQSRTTEHVSEKPDGLF